jgi:hypothetical protein
MSLPFYMDVHVPAAITEGLRQRGIDVLTSQEDDTRTTEDEVLLERAGQLERILFPQDDDLLQVGAEWQKTGRVFLGIVYVHQLGPGIGRIIEDLEILSTCATADELRNRIWYLPLD